MSPGTSGYNCWALEKSSGPFPSICPSHNFHLITTNLIHLKLRKMLQFRTKSSRRGTSFNRKRVKASTLRESESFEKLADSWKRETKYTNDISRPVEKHCVARDVLCYGITRIVRQFSNVETIPANKQTPWIDRVSPAPFLPLSLCFFPSCFYPIE